MTPIAPRRRSPSIRSGPLPTLAFSRVGSDVELDGEDGVEARVASGKIASVTRLRSSRNRACRSRFERCPFGVRDHARLRRRLCARRRSGAQSRQHAPTAAQDPQNTWTFPQTTQRPNRPSKAPRLLYGAAGHARQSTPLFHSARASLRCARHEGSGGSDPGLHLSPTRAFYSSVPSASPHTMRERPTNISLGPGSCREHAPEPRHDGSRPILHGPSTASSTTYQSPPRAPPQARCRGHGCHGRLVTTTTREETTTNI